MINRNGTQTTAYFTTAISSEPRRDDWFKPEAHLDVYGTKFKVISIIKGAADEGIVQFRHYDTVPPGGEWLWRGVNRNPQILHFEPGQSYIIFAKKADKPGVWHQPWHSGNVLPLQGVLLCANSELYLVPNVCPHRGGPLKFGRLNAAGELVCPMHYNAFSIESLIANRATLRLTAS